MFESFAAVQLDLALLTSYAVRWGAAEQGKNCHFGSTLTLVFHQHKGGEGGESVPWQPVSLRCLIVSPLLWCRRH